MSDVRAEQHMDEAEFLIPKRISELPTEIQIEAAKVKAILAVAEWLRAIARQFGVHES